MDDRRSIDHAERDGEIADQLRAYAEALTPPTDRPQPIVGLERTVDRRRFGARAIAIAAALLAATVVTGWAVLRTDGATPTDTVDSVEPEPNGDGERDGEPTDDAIDRTDDATVAGGRPLLDSTRWAIIEHHPADDDPADDDAAAVPPSTGAPAQAPLWAWRLDGAVYVLVEGYTGAADPLDRAEPSAEGNRVTLGWIDGSAALGLQSYDVDAATVLATAGRLERRGDGWSLAGGEVLVADPDPGPPMPSDQIGLAPIDDGRAGLAATVTMLVSDGGPAAMYRELFEASSIGTVTEVDIAGSPGFLIVGPLVSYAVAAGDGWSASWQTLDPDVDLGAVVDQTELVEPEAWRSAAERAEVNLEAALGAVAAERQAQAERRAEGEGGVEDSASTEPPFDPADLPRYRLPEPWRLAWVTDMGLWTDEQWAQRQALFEANRPAGVVFPDLVRTQGFRITGTDAGVPVAIPEVVVTIHRFAEQRPAEHLVTEGGRPIEVAGLTGAIDEVMTLGGPLAIIGVGDDRHHVEIRAAGIAEDDLVAFAATLGPVGPDLADGLRSDDRAAELVVDLPGSAGERSRFRSRSLTAYEDLQDPDGRGPTVSVETLDRQQFALGLAPLRPPLDGSEWRLIDGGRFLFQSADAIQAAADADPEILIDDPVPSTLVRYDPADEIAITLHAAMELDELIDLFDRLEPVELDAWRELVEPYNADPVRPR